MQRKWIGVTFVGLVFVLGLIGFVFWFNDTGAAAKGLPKAEVLARGSGVPLTRTDLFGPETVKDQDNAFLSLKEVGEGLTKKGADFTAYLAGQGNQDAVAAKLKEIAPELAKARQAALKPKYDSKQDWDNGFAMRIPGLQTNIDVVRALCANAVYEARTGNKEGATQDLIASRFIATNIASEPTLMNAAAAYACDAVALSAANDVMASIKSDIIALTSIQELILIKSLKPKWVRTMRGEAYLGLATIRNLGQLGGIDKALSDKPMLASAPARTGEPPKPIEKAYMARHLELWANVLGYAVRNSDDDLAMVKQAAKTIRAETNARRASNAIEGRLTNGWDGAVTMMLRDRAAAQVGWMLCRVLAFHTQQKRFPSDLKELGDVPKDLFDEKPLRYKVTGDEVRIWSVGPDLKDDGGTKEASIPMTPYDQVTPGDIVAKYNASQR